MCDAYLGFYFKSHWKDSFRFRYKQNLHTAYLIFFSFLSELKWNGYVHQEAKIPLTTQHVDKLIEELDKDGDKEIDFR